MSFKTNIKFTEKELEKIIKWMLEWDDYRGGMLTRVDGIDILNSAKSKLKYLKSKQKKRGKNETKKENRKKV